MKISVSILLSCLAGVGIASPAWMSGGAPASLRASADPGPPIRLLHEVFTDHAVLQRDRPIAVWGEATAGDRVTLSMGAATLETRADAGGHWRATLPAQPAGGPFTLSVHKQTVDGAGRLRLG